MTRYAAGQPEFLGLEGETQCLGRDTEECVALGTAWGVTESCGSQWAPGVGSAIDHSGVQKKMWPTEPGCDGNPSIAVDPRDPAL